MNAQAGRCSWLVHSCCLVEQGQPPRRMNVCFRQPSTLGGGCLLHNQQHGTEASSKCPQLTIDGSPPTPINGTLIPPYRQTDRQTDRGTNMLHPRHPINQSLNRGACHRRPRTILSMMSVCTQSTHSTYTPAHPLVHRSDRLHRLIASAPERGEGERQRGERRPRAMRTYETWALIKATD